MRARTYIILQQHIYIYGTYTVSGLERDIVSCGGRWGISRPERRLSLSLKPRARVHTFRLDEILKEIGCIIEKERSRLSTSSCVRLLFFHLLLRERKHEYRTAAAATF